MITVIDFGKVEIDGINAGSITSVISNHPELLVEIEAAMNAYLQRYEGEADKQKLALANAEFDRREAELMAELTQAQGTILEQQVQIRTLEGQALELNMQSQATIAALENRIAELMAPPEIDWAKLAQGWGATKASQRLGFSQVDRALLAVNPSVEVLQSAIDSLDLDDDETEEVLAVFSGVI